MTGLYELFLLVRMGNLYLACASQLSGSFAHLTTVLFSGFSETEQQNSIQTKFIFTVILVVNFSFAIRIEACGFSNKSYRFRRNFIVWPWSRQFIVDFH